MKIEEGRMKRATVCLVLIIQLMLIADSFGQHPPEITNGLDYLSAIQNADGSWGGDNSLTDILPATVSVIDVLKVLDETGTTGYADAVSWLGSQTLETTDHLSRRIGALLVPGTDIDTLFSYMDESTYGWGGQEDYGLNNLDTALALFALSRIAYPDHAIVASAAGYLTDNQNTDGGWGFEAGDDSNVYMTATVLNTLAQFKDIYALETPINDAAAYLLTQQNMDGGFGSSDSTVYETALAVEALVACGTDIVAEAPLAASYLMSTQLPDGSWDDDPYETALAIRALSKVKPNLSISNADISFSVTMPQEGEPVTIFATVWNKGIEEASDVAVQFFLGDPSAGGMQIGSDHTIASLAPGDSAQVSVTDSFAGTGGRTVFVQVDPEDVVSETVESDNEASTRLWIATGPDLAVFSEELVPSTYIPAPDTPLSLEYTVRNIGETTVDETFVSLYDGDPTQGGVYLDGAPLYGLAGGSSRTGTFGVTLSEAGSHALYVVVDSNDQVSEISETNNIATCAVQVGGTQQMADLSIRSADIVLTPSRPSAGETVEIVATVRNGGTESADDFTVEFFDGAPESGGTLIHSQVVSLAPGEEQSVIANWSVSAGIHDLFVILDRDNLIVEISETNNRVWIPVMTDMVDISVSASDLVFTPSWPVVDDDVALTITVHNRGIVETGPFSVALYDGLPDEGGVLLSTFPVATIVGDGSETFVYNFVAQAGIYRFWAIADIESQVTELSEANNQAMRSMIIKGPGETYGPDLVPTEFAFSEGTVTDSQTLQISGAALVTFQNKGDEKIEDAFDVLVFEDTDKDGHYTEGVDTLLGTESNTIFLWPNGANMVEVPLSGTITFVEAPLSVLIDSGDAVVEQDEENNIITGQECEVRPEEAMAAVVEWSWKLQSYRVDVPAVVTNVTDDNGDGEIDGNDTPDVVVGMFTGSGRLVALSGDTGQEIFSTVGHMTGPMPFIAAGDIDADGLPEFLAPKYGIGGHGLFAFEHDGTLKWDNGQMVTDWNAPGAHPYQRTTIYNTGTPLLADLDADGEPEIIEGATVMNADGSIEWVRDTSISFAEHTPGAADFGIGNWKAVSSVADLDMDGMQEVVAGNTAYAHDGTVKWWNYSPGVRDGINAVANLDDDPFPEVVLVTARSHYPYMPSTNPRVYVLEHDGTLKWGPVLLEDIEPPESQSFSYGGPPTVADFDGDGEIEIGVHGYDYYFILDRNGNLENSLYIPYLYNYQGGDGYYSAATVFDLNGDGRPEVIINCNRFFRIFDGKEGTLLYEDSFGGGNNSYQNVVIADVDGDDQAEVVATGYGYHTGGDAVRVYGSLNNDWVNARRVWNEAPYHVTNIEDNETIPQYEAPSWLLDNTYRSQTPVGEYENPYLTPNLTASYLRVTQDNGSLNLIVRVGNGGAKEALSGVSIAFYDGTPGPGTLIGSASTTMTLEPGEYQDVVYTWGGASIGLHNLYAVVDSDDTVQECSEDDNQTDCEYTVEEGFPDLAVTGEDISVPSGPYYEGSLIPVTAAIRNVGSISVSTVLVRLYNGNPAEGGVEIGASQISEIIDPDGSASVQFTFDTMGSLGTNVLYVMVDPEDTIVEEDENNNLTPFFLEVETPVLPNFVIAPEDIQISPNSPQEGEAVQITALVTNRGSAAGDIPVSIYLGDPGAGGELISAQTIYPILGLGESAAVEATLDTVGHAGDRDIYVEVDPEGVIPEGSEYDNIASQSLFIQSAGLDASVTLNKTMFVAEEDVEITVTGSDSLGVARSLFLDVVVVDSVGNQIAFVTQSEPISIDPNGQVTTDYIWNTGTTLTGDYSVTTTLYDSAMTPVARASVPMSISTSGGISSNLALDKISYNANENVTIISWVTNDSVNEIYEGITATVTIEDSLSQVLFTDHTSIGMLVPGASRSFNPYWNTSTNPPGDYPVTLEVKDSSGTVVSTSTKNLTISSDIVPSALLTGALSVDTQSLFTGDPVNIGYSITNVGNIDLSLVDVSILTVHVVELSVYDTLTDQTGLLMGETYGNSQVLDTAAYSAKDYLVILRVNISGTEETLAGTYFRVEGAPSAPSLYLPGQGNDVETYTPILEVNNSSDPNDDDISYEFELYSDSNLTALLASSGTIEEGNNTTSWQVPIELAENETYYWRARAYDELLYGDWMITASFRVNVYNDLPTAPTLSSPADSSEVDTLTPVLVINNASDPDSTGLTYDFEVATDADFTNIVASEIGIPEGGGTTSWLVSVSLEENTWYYWRALADDWLDMGPWMETAMFFVNTANDAPSAPTVISPEDASEIATLYTDIILSNSTDADYDPLTYLFEVDTLSSFDSANLIQSVNIPEGIDTTAWYVDGFADNMDYFTRAKASDGLAESQWSGVIGFFVNTANDAPTTPVLANPSDGAGVNVFTPALSVHNAEDIDKDALTYEFEVYDETMTSLISSVTGVEETPDITSWTVPVPLTENMIYAWRARAYDGELYSGWMPFASFMVNTANDAPSAPTLNAPSEGSSVETEYPTVSVNNAADPDSDILTYDFEIYTGGALVDSFTGIPEDISGVTAVTLINALSDNTIFTWRARAHDGDRYGAWMDMATFTVHLPVVNITATIDFNPNTLNRNSNGKWVTVFIELPDGYDVNDIIISSILLENTVPAESRPWAIGDHDHDGIPDLKVKFKRSDVIDVLLAGDNVPVLVTGELETVTFDGIDIIRVIH
jgi:subtilase family serine protease